MDDLASLNREVSQVVLARCLDGNKCFGVLIQAERLPGMSRSPFNQRNEPPRGRKMGMK